MTFESFDCWLSNWKFKQNPSKPYSEHSIFSLAREKPGESFEMALNTLKTHICRLCFRDVRSLVNIFNDCEANILEMLNEHIGQVGLPINWRKWRILAHDLPFSSITPHRWQKWTCFRSTFAADALSKSPTFTSFIVTSKRRNERSSRNWWKMNRTWVKR